MNALWLALRRLGLGLALIATASSLLLVSSRSERSRARPSTGAAPSKTWNVNILEFVNVVDSEEAEQGILEGLKASGLVEGRDYTITIRNAQGDMPTLGTLVDTALTEGADLIMTLSTPTLQAALQRSRGVPIVFTFTANAVAAGAGRSNTDHLPNVTGVPTASAYAELVAVLRVCMPDVRRIGSLLVPSEVNSVYNTEQLELEAAKFGIELVTVPVNGAAEMSDAALALCSRNIDAVVQVGSNLTAAAFVSITEAARRARIPVFGSLSGNSKDGAMVVLARDYVDGGREAGALAARVIRGESPASIPFQPLTTIRLLVNLDAARHAGLRLPPALVARAVGVIGKP